MICDELGIKTAGNELNDIELETNCLIESILNLWHAYNESMLPNLKLFSFDDKGKMYISNTITWDNLPHQALFTV